MNIRCIAIDDEALAIDILEDYISKFPMLELTGKFDSAVKAMDCISQNKVDLIFLDINMPDINGIMFYENLLNKPKVIFTTAYTEYAVKGFEINAVDYLLKPISFDRFFKAIGKVINMNTGSNKEVSVPESIASQDFVNYIFVKVEHSNIKINLQDIVYMEGYKDYVKIHLLNQVIPIMTLSSIKHYEESLFSKRFVRVHKRFLVSIDKIENISRNNIKLVNKEEYIPIGNSYREFFFELVVRNNL